MPDAVAALLSGRPDGQAKPINTITTPRLLLMPGRKYAPTAGRLHRRLVGRFIAGKICEVTLQGGESFAGQG